jgi:spermidine/putrescine transport system permease protein
MSAVAESTIPLARRRATGARVLAFVRRHLLTVYALIAFTYLLLPVAVVIAFSFNNPHGRFNYTWQGFTIKNWVNWDAIPGLRGAIQISL